MTFDAAEYYKDLYEKEIEFSEQLNGKIGNSITLLTVIGSGHILLLSNIFPLKLPSSISSIIFLILWGISAMLFVWAVFRFILAYSKYTYARFPIESMGRAIDQTINYYQKRWRRDEADTYINKMLAERYRNDAIANRRENVRKNRNHRLLSIAIILAFLSLAVSFVFWIMALKR